MGFVMCGFWMLLVLTLAVLVILALGKYLSS
jgi:hypothetical protein